MSEANNWDFISVQPAEKRGCFNLMSGQVPLAHGTKEQFFGLIDYTKCDFLTKATKAQAALKTYKFAKSVNNLGWPNGVEVVLGKFRETIAPSQKKVEEKKLPPLPAPNIKRLKDLITVSWTTLEICMATEISIQFSGTNPINLIVLGGFGVGKTTITRYCSDSRIAVIVDEATPHADAPGRANIEIEAAKGYVESAKGKTIIQDDIVSFMVNEDDAAEYIARHTNNFGKKQIFKWDGAGEHKVETGYNLIFGATEGLIRKFSRITADQGPRFLVHKMNRDRSNLLPQICEEAEREINQLVTSIVLDCKSKQLPIVPEIIMHTMFDFAQRLTAMRTAHKVWELADCEYADRLTHQLLLLIQCRALLNGRPVESGDVCWAQAATYKTVPFVYEWRRLYAYVKNQITNLGKWDKVLLNHCERLQIINVNPNSKETKFVGDWEEFIYSVVMNVPLIEAEKDDDQK